MPKSRFGEYVEFRLMDPRKIKQGIIEATVIHIGVLLRGAPIAGARNNPSMLGAAINRNILEMAHTTKGREALRTRGPLEQGTGSHQFYYCAVCSGSLKPAQCSGPCQTRYKARGIAFNMLQPVLPVNVAAYMLAQGHRFEMIP